MRSFKKFVQKTLGRLPHFRREPADISVLLIYLASGQKRKDACQSNPTIQQEGGSRYD